MERDESQNNCSNQNQECEFISLSEAAHVAPGRPSVNAVWRWARRGVLSRGGERVKLQHLRIGGKLFTSRQWVRDFGGRLAAADATHFQQLEMFSLHRMCNKLSVVRGLIRSIEN